MLNRQVQTHYYSRRCISIMSRLLNFGSDEDEHLIPLLDKSTIIFSILFIISLCYCLFGLSLFINQLCRIEFGIVTLDISPHHLNLYGYSQLNLVDMLLKYLNSTDKFHIIYFSSKIPNNLNCTNTLCNWFSFVNMMLVYYLDIKFHRETLQAFCTIYIHSTSFYVQPHINYNHKHKTSWLNSHLWFLKHAIIYFSWLNSRPTSLDLRDMLISTIIFGMLPFCFLYRSYDSNYINLVIFIDWLTSYLIGQFNKEIWIMFFAKNCLIQHIMTTICLLCDLSFGLFLFSGWIMYLMRSVWPQLFSGFIFGDSEFHFLLNLLLKTYLYFFVFYQFDDISMSSLLFTASIVNCCVLVLHHNTLTCGLTPILLNNF